MKNAANIVGVVGILIAVYAIIGRFVGAPTIGLGIMQVKAVGGGLAVANAVMLIALVLKQMEK